MLVRFRDPKPETYSGEEARYVARSQLRLTADRDYEVHAVSVYDGVAFMQIVDDLDTPVFLPRLLFYVVDPSIPDDWICNTFPIGPVQLVVGPRFVAEDLKSYEAMVDLMAEQQRSFWRRIKDRREHYDD